MPPIVHNAIVSLVGFSARTPVTFIFDWLLEKISLSAIGDRFEMECRLQAADAVVTKRSASVSYSNLVDSR